MDSADSTEHRRKYLDLNPICLLLTVDIWGPRCYSGFTFGIQSCHSTEEENLDIYIPHAHIPYSSVDIPQRRGYHQAIKQNEERVTWSKSLVLEMSRKLHLNNMAS